ncbi:MAG: MATE family efflux transporter [Oligosphaeraceae bacterium]|nr:MATE family efflux transporter [Oligosphaeraceae bacterium]
MQKRSGYLTGSIGSTMLKTAVAMVPGTLAMVGYNLADAYYVGKLGTAPQAAMAYSLPVIMLLGCVFHGIATGISAPAAMLLGSDAREKAARLVSAGLLLLALCSIILGLLGINCIGWTFRQFGARGEALELVSGYMSIWYLGCVTGSLSMAGNNILIATGDSRWAGGMMIFGMTLNVILDPLLIFGYAGLPALGIRGAAIATVLAQLVAALMVLILLKKRYRLLIFRNWDLVWLPKLWRTVIRYAIPASIGMLLMPLGTAVITRITAHFGDAAVAGCGIAARIESFAFIFPMALGMSLMPMVGQNFGAQFYSRIRQCRRFAMHFAFLYLGAMAVIYFFAAPFMAGLFSTDPLVQRTAVLFLRIVPWGFGMIEIHRYSGFFFTGCAFPAAAAWLNALRILGLMLPLSFLALLLNSVAWLFIARLVGDVLAGSIGCWGAARLTSRFPPDGQAVPEAFTETPVLSFWLPRMRKT